VTSTGGLSHGKALLAMLPEIPSSFGQEKVFRINRKNSC
jgi:hypothetical protein